MAFSRSSSYENVAAALTEWHRQNIENDRFIISSILYREALSSFKYINTFYLTKYCIFSTSELIAWIQLLVSRESKITNAPTGNEEILI